MGMRKTWGGERNNDDKVEQSQTTIPLRGYVNLGCCQVLKCILSFLPSLLHFLQRIKEPDSTFYHRPDNTLPRMICQVAAISWCLADIPALGACFARLLQFLASYPCGTRPFKFSPHIPQQANDKGLRWSVSFTKATVQSIYQARRTTI